MIIYNFPQNTGIDLPVETSARAGFQHPNIIGIKESSRQRGESHAVMVNEAATRLSRCSPDR